MYPLHKKHKIQLTSAYLAQFATEFLDLVRALSLTTDMPENLLLEAAEHGYFEIATVCILSDANIHVRKKYSPEKILTPVEIATEKGHPSVAQLLSNTAESNMYLTRRITTPNIQSCRPTNIGEQGKINISLMQFQNYLIEHGMHDADAWKKINKVIKKKTFPEAYPELVKLIKSAEKTLARNILNFGIAINSLGICQLCIDAKALLNSADPHHGTPLHHAVSKGHLHIAALFLHFGANVNARHPVDESTPLMLATVNQHEQLVEFLISKGAKPELQNIAGETALQIEAQQYQHIAQQKQKHQQKIARTQTLLVHAQRNMDKSSDEYRQMKQEYLEMQIVQFPSGPYIIQQICGVRHQGVNDWKSSLNLEVAFERLKDLHNEVIQCFQKSANSDKHLAQELLPIVAKKGYTALIRICLEAGASISKLEAENAALVHRYLMSNIALELQNPLLLSRSVPASTSQQQQHSPTYQKI